MFRRQTKVPVEGVLRVKVDAPMLEERIELLLCRPILRIELVNVVIRHVKRDVYKRQVQRQGPCTLSLRDGRRELDGTRHTVYRGDERAALQYRVHDTGTVSYTHLVRAYIR